MLLKINISALMLFLSITCAGQIITLRGKVTNQQTGESLPGASVMSGPYGTSADSRGEFVMFVQKEIAEQFGLTVSNVGYQNLHVTYKVDDYDLKLAPMSQELETVVISGGAEDIVQKAFRQIGGNYPDKSCNMIGLEQMVHSVDDEFGYQYFYRNSAKIKLYISAYSDTAKTAQVGLVAKKDYVAKNPDAAQIKFVDGYRIAITRDYVHNRTALLKGNTKWFIYKFNRREWLNGTRVYVINFFSKKDNTNAGILYIDTASYAFVKILRTLNNVKSKGFIDLDKVTSLTQYSKYADRWVLDNVLVNSITQFHGYNVGRTEAIQLAIANAETAAPLPENAVIARHAIDEKIDPSPEFTPADKKALAEIQKMADRIFIKARMPDIADKVHTYRDN